MPSDGGVIRVQREGGALIVRPLFLVPWGGPHFSYARAPSIRLFLLVMYACQICFSDFCRGVFEGSLPFSPEKEEVIVRVSSGLPCHCARGDFLY